MVWKGGPPANGQTIGYVYDDLYRMTQKNYPNSTNVEYAYDLVGKLQQVTDPTGTYGFAYDNMGRLVRNYHAVHIRDWDLHERVHV